MATTILRHPLDDVRTAAERRREAERNLETAVALLRTQMRAARQAGWSTTEIAEYAGLSRQRVNLATKG